MTEVAQGVHAIPLPIAEEGGREPPQVYWIVGSDRGALIDVGYGDDTRSREFRDSWVGLTAGLPSLPQPPLLLLTDHYGEHVDGAKAFKTMTDAQVALGSRDVETVRSSTGDDSLIDIRLEGGEEFDLGGGKRVVAVPTPGHAPGSISFLLRDEGILFTGDFILGTDTSTTINSESGGDMADHVTSLHRVREFDLKLVLSFHGPPVTDPASRIDWLLDRRKERENQVLALLNEGLREVDAIRDRMYEGLADGLRDAARHQIVANLAKLVSEGRAREVKSGHVYGSVPPVRRNHDRQPS